MRINLLFRRRVTAFTLVELLVVIAVIALLLAVMMPVLARARELGKSAVCRSNLRNIGMATLTYANDYGGKLPPYEEKSNTTMASSYGWKRYWWGRILPYLISQGLKNQVTLKVDVFACPSKANSSISGGITYGTSDIDKVEYGVVHSYYVKAKALFATDDYITPPPPVGFPWTANLTNIRNTNGLFMVMDSGDRPWLGDTTKLYNADYVTTPYTNGTDCALGDIDRRDERSLYNDIYTNYHVDMRHPKQRGCNAVFVDGHVENVKMKGGWIERSHWVVVKSK
jgi:prepilin-type processing-associated H-X9-DG protein